MNKKEEIKKAKQFYFKENSFLKCFLSRNIHYYQYKLIRSYYSFSFSKNTLTRFFHYRKYAKYSRMLNVQINCKSILRGFRFFHSNIVISKEAIVGENLSCGGNNCIGAASHGAPTIGNNVKLGFGAIVLGKVTIADNVYIGAGAIVTKDCLIEGAKIIGINKLL